MFWQKLKENNLCCSCHIAKKVDMRVFTAYNNLKLLHLPVIIIFGLVSLEDRIHLFNCNKPKEMNPIFKALLNVL